MRASQQKAAPHFRFGSIAPNRLARDAGGMSAMPPKATVCNQALLSKFSKDVLTSRLGKSVILWAYSKCGRQERAACGSRVRGKYAGTLHQ